ncbi:hypothetical protein GGR58DRAFT_496876 [Xylaria digitata]|nr:hypothetical protein GGR58DRAFT_496876 [Xylaria digitata]
MEWISQKKQLLGADLAEFRFNPGTSCLIQTTVLRRDDSGKVEVVDDGVHKSEGEYREWVEQASSLLLSPWLDEPAVVLVMHQRLDLGSRAATLLPYGEEIFKTAHEKLFQHRSIADTVRRVSTAIFTCRKVAPWKSKPEWGPAVVYNCKSDTESLAIRDDMILSLTHFPQKPMIFAVFYGCTKENREYIHGWFKWSKASAFDPLHLPMIYSELERRRLANELDTKSTIIEVENRLTLDGRRESGQSSNSGMNSTNGNIAQREREAMNLWVEVSSLKNGLESFRIELISMLGISKKPLENDILGDDAVKQRDPIYKHSSECIQARIHDMIVEIDSIVKRTESLLHGLSLATQIESTYLARRDTWATISIAAESKRDSSHMRYISILGMVFLPGTFFATLFSMGFFHWIPDESTQMISPWVAVYFGITLLATIGTLLSFRYWAKKRDEDASHAIYTKPHSESGMANSPTGGSQVV